MRLAYERRGSGEPLVLIHGTASQWQVWRPVLNRLAAERDVIAPDLPGFGGTPPLSGEPVVTPERYAQVVAAFLDELELERAHVAGNSLGGGVALELARMGRARSATALSPIGFWTDRESAFCRASILLTRRLARTLRPVAPLLVGNPVTCTPLSLQLQARPWRMPPAYALEGARNIADCPGLMAALDGYRHWRFTRPAELSCPVTIAWGERDRLLIPRQAGRARRLLPHARHVTLRGCGHVPTWDDPEQVARVLLEGSSEPR
jgi:pimeloyl-ACP methyl ester carboxylesterase